MAKKPNVIFFFSDQQRWDTVGCYGQKLDITPNLDKIAEKGVKFEHAFTCQPVCGPARACLQTGKYATETGCYRNDIALPLDEKTIAHHFSEEGYEVAYVGKWHLASTGEEENYTVSAVPPERRGGWKDYWVAADVLEFTSDGYGGHMFDGDMNQVDFEGFRADCVTDFALDYIKNRDSEKPFALFLSHIEPHHQNNHKRVEGPVGSKDKYNEFEVPDSLADTEGNWNQNYPDYLGCCASLDKNVGRVMDVLKEKGLEEDTVFIYTSDHGCHFRTRNNEYKRSCHEDSIRVPMIAYGGPFQGGKEIKELVSLMDVPPTLLACAGIKTPETMQGRPLQQLVEGNAKAWPKEVFFQISEAEIGRGIRTDRWTYSVTAIEKDKTKGWKRWKNQAMDSDVYYETYLYDLKNDPNQKNNLVADPAYEEVRKELKERLKVRIEQANEKVPEILAYRAE